MNLYALRVSVVNSKKYLNMKLFRSKQIASLDTYTIKYEPIASIDLMERASNLIFNEIVNHYEKCKHFVFFIGPGNNGGDGLAVARMLAAVGFNCTVYLVVVADKLSEDATVNLQRLKKQKLVPVYEIKKKTDLPTLEKDFIIVDALFGSGLSRPLDGLAAQVVLHINNSFAEVIAIDIPSGLFGEDNFGNNFDYIVKAAYTLSFQFPKISFLFAENDAFVGKWKVLQIGLHSDAITNTESNYFFLTQELIAQKLKKRNKFSHKGIFGHAWLAAGSYGKIGAAVLSAKSCLRSGVGLLTVFIPKVGYEIMQTSIPEAMVSVDDSKTDFSILPGLFEYDAIGIGPGIGTNEDVQKFLKKILKNVNIPMVFDADALSIFAENKSLLKLIPPDSILTPHPGEFDRMAGKSLSGFERHIKQIEFAIKYKIYIVLKGSYTSIACPDGSCYFNSTGNPGMATAGSGDVLTGIILSLLAQKYISANAALIGVYLHGLAGDFAKEERGEESLIAGDIIENIGKAFKEIKN